MNCDRIARWYRWLEYAAFGKQLERCRKHFLDEINGASRVLMLGEGDGRFLHAFAEHAHAVIHYVDASAAMVALARRRLAGAEEGNSTTSFFRSDLRAQPPGSSYDLVVTHFVLDCFDEQDLDRIAATISGSVTSDARWLISEFRLPSRGIWKYVSILILQVIYLFFRWTTGLAVRALPDYRAALRSHGFMLEREHLFLKGLLVAELWRRKLAVGRL